jgi:UDP-glucuronate 4-epimerase
MKALVTGVAGFIAAEVARQLLESGHEVVGVDNLNDYYDVRLKDYRLSRLLGQPAPSAGGLTRSGHAPGGVARRADGCFEFRALDIEDGAALDAVFAQHRFDVVFNLAGRAGVRYSLENPHVYLATNTLGTLNVLESMRRHGVKKHVLASTSSLYAGCPMPFREDLPVDTPLSPYAVTKRAAELMAYSYHRLYGIDSTVVRYFTVYGPAGRPDMSVFRFIKWIEEGTPLTLFGDGSQARDFTYVEDIARGTILASKPLGFEIINLGGGRNPVTLQELINWIEAALEQKAVIYSRPFHAADVKETWADIGKASRLLEWIPMVPVRTGISHTVAWHQEHREWLRSIQT